MAKRVSIDRWLFGAALLLVLLGLVMVFSASAVMAKDRFGSPYTFLLRQVGWACAGVMAMLMLKRVDYRRYKHPAVVFTLLGITMLMLIAVLFLDRSHNTHRWIRIGILSFQPSELAKPALILFLAFFLETRTQAIDDWRRTLLPAVLPSLIFSVLIVKQPDLGTALVCMAMTASVLFVSGVELKYLGYGLAASLPALYYLLFHVGFRRQRMLAFVNPWADPQGAGFHMIQSLIAVGTGGITGLGLMEGKQKLFYLPEPHTDFIFAVIGEELGLLGTIAVVGLFALVCYRGMRIAIRTSDLYARFLAVGITSTIAIQAFFNISVVLGLLPTKGIPLPFISYGGSSLFITLACVGVLLNISQQTD
ncbi:MAG TPA: putative lipid II flippase FtsW [Terriglobales bacterium]|nr:putative lipid II flippase FtsW [Terriglobales bacterium]